MDAMTNISVVDYLNQAITRETEAIVFYSTHAAVQDRSWGLGKLAGQTMDRAKGEMHHLDEFTDRLTELNGTLDAERVLRPIRIGSSPLEQMRIVLDLEAEAIELYNKAIMECCSAGDNASRALFEAILKDEVEHHQYAAQAIEQAMLMTEANWVSTLA